MRISSTLLLTLLLSLTQVSLAGGPSASSPVFRFGTIKVFTPNTNLILFSEQIKVRLEGDYSIVSAQFDILNNQEKEVAIEYGFPVEFTENFEQEFVWKDDYLPVFNLNVDDKKATYSQTMDMQPVLTDSISRPDGTKFVQKVQRKWYKAALLFPALQNHTITLEMKIKNNFEDWDFGRSFLPEYSSRSLQIDFSPSMGLGMGPEKNTIPNLNVMVECLEVPQDLVRLVGNVGGYVSSEVGFTGEKDLGTYVLNRSNANLQKFSSLRVECDYNIQKLGKAIYQNTVPTEKILTRKCSSESTAYTADNLYDFDYNTAWSEGTPHQGAGEWFEVKFDDYPVGAIVILNGYYKNGATYYNNGRVSKIKVEREYLDPTNRIKTDEHIINLPDRPYKEIDDVNYARCIDIVKDFGVITPRVRRIRLTILEAHPGKKGHETCITEVFFVGKESNAQAPSPSQEKEKEKAAPGKIK
ncbi:MAG: NADase-type glycan-binding domain-containing protein [Bacteroidia bacterium]